MFNNVTVWNLCIACHSSNADDVTSRVGIGIGYWHELAVVSSIYQPTTHMPCHKAMCLVRCFLPFMPTFQHCATLKQHSLHCQFANSMQAYVVIWPSADVIFIASLVVCIENMWFLVNWLSLSPPKIPIAIQGPWTVVPFVTWSRCHTQFSFDDKAADHWSYVQLQLAYMCSVAHPSTAETRQCLHDWIQHYGCVTVLCQWDAATCNALQPATSAGCIWYRTHSLGLCVGSHSLPVPPSYAVGSPTS